MARYRIEAALALGKGLQAFSRLPETDQMAACCYQEYKPLKELVTRDLMKEAETEAKARSLFM